MRRAAADAACHAECAVIAQGAARSRRQRDGCGEVDKRVVARQRVGGPSFRPVLLVLAFRFQLCSHLLQFTCARLKLIVGGV